MDIAGIGSAFLDDHRLGGDIVNRSKNAANDDFVNHLKNAVNKDAEAGKAIIDKTDKLYEQCLELEIFLVKTLVSSMRNTVQKSGLINEGFAGKMYEDMLYDEYARDFAKNSNFGLAEMAYLELSGQRGKPLRGETV